jgi:hypothetical protein
MSDHEKPASGSKFEILRSFFQSSSSNQTKPVKLKETLGNPTQIQFVEQGLEGSHQGQQNPHLPVEASVSPQAVENEVKQASSYPYLFHAGKFDIKFNAYELYSQMITADASLGDLSKYLPEQALKSALDNVDEFRKDLCNNLRLGYIDWETINLYAKKLKAAKSVSSFPEVQDAFADLILEVLSSYKPSNKTVFVPSIAVPPQHRQDFQQRAPVDRGEIFYSSSFSKSTQEKQVTSVFSAVRSVYPYSDQSGNKFGAYELYEEMCLTSEWHKRIPKQALKSILENVDKFREDLYNNFKLGRINWTNMTVIAKFSQEITVAKVKSLILEVAGAYKVEKEQLVALEHASGAGIGFFKQSSIQPVSLSRWLEGLQSGLSQNYQFLIYCAKKFNKYDVEIIAELSNLSVEKLNKLSDELAEFMDSASREDCACLKPLAQEVRRRLHEFDSGICVEPLDPRILFAWDHDTYNELNCLAISVESNGEGELLDKSVGKLKQILDGLERVIPKQSETPPHLQRLAEIVQSCLDKKTNSASIQAGNR